MSGGGERGFLTSDDVGLRGWEGVWKSMFLSEVFCGCLLNISHEKYKYVDSSFETSDGWIKWDK